MEDAEFPQLLQPLSDLMPIAEARRILAGAPEGESTERFRAAITEYEQATGWKNDPNKAGLDLQKPNR